MKSVVGRTAGVVYGLVLSHENERNSFCEFSEDAVGRVDVVPNPGICKCGLIRSVDCLNPREKL